MQQTSDAELAEVFPEFLSMMHKGCDADTLDVFVELDLTLTQARVIFTLALYEQPMPINRVAERIHVSMATVCRTVDRLVALGMIDRREDPADRRSKLVSLAAEGQRLIDSHRGAVLERVRAFAEELPADVAENLRVAMLAAIDSVPAHVYAGGACGQNEIRDQVRTCNS